nr:hypothetical protein [Gemmatimonadota bacterium]
MIISATLLFLQAAVLTPPNLVVRQGQTVKVVPVVGTVNGSYVRADLLAAALGGTVADAPNDHYRVNLGDTRIEVTEGVSFLRADSVIVPLGMAPLRSGRTFLLPYQIVAAIIPRYATGFNYDLSTRELMMFSSLARRGPDPVPERPVQSSEPLAAQTEPPRKRAARTGQRRMVVIDAGHGGPD